MPHAVENMENFACSFPKFLRFTHWFNFLKVWVEGFKVLHVLRFDVRMLQNLCCLEGCEAQTKDVFLPLVSRGDAETVLT